MFDAYLRWVIRSDRRTAWMIGLAQAITIACWTYIAYEAIKHLLGRNA